MALGGLAIGSARQVAEASRLDELESEATDERALLEHLLAALRRQGEGLRAARDLAGEIGDGDTEDLLTAQITALEKNAWFLSASLEH